MQLPKYNAAALFTINIPNFKPIDATYNPSKPLFAINLENMGWPDADKGVLPLFVIDHNFYKSNLGRKWQPKVYIACILPEKIFTMTDEKQREQAVTRWLKTIASYVLKIQMKYFEPYPLANGKPCQNEFTTETWCVDNPVRILPNGKIICLLGDCAMDSVYQTALGSAFARNEGIAAAKCVLNDSEIPQKRFQPLIDLYNTYQRMLLDRIKYMPFNKPYAPDDANDEKMQVTPAISHQRKTSM